MTPTAERMQRPGRTRLDLLIAFAILVELELETWLDPSVGAPHRVLTSINAVVFVAPLAARRRWPDAALIACAALATLGQLLGGRLAATSGLGMLLALVLLAYSTGAWLEWRRGLAALIVAMAAFSGFVFASGSTAAGGVDTELFFAALAFAAPWAVGRLVRERSRRTVAFEELAAEAATEREHRKHAAVIQERLRIGRDLQDIVAHRVSAMVIQAGGARQQLHHDHERSRDSILAIERTGREALADLRRLLGMLRKGDDPSALAPQPGLDQLQALVEAARARQLDCVLRTEGPAIVLTPGIDLVGYRVIEAALHAASQCSRSIVVTVRYSTSHLELEVRGDGPLPDVERELRSISERVALYDGSLAVQTGEQLAIHAKLPLGEALAA